MRKHTNPLNYFLRFSKKIFPDFWPQATPYLAVGQTPLIATRLDNLREKRRFIPEKEVMIMTQLSEKDRKAQMADMASFDEQMPCIGIFWYDPEEHNFFGVYKKEITPRMVEEAAEKGVPFINYPKLHRQVWAKEYFRAQATHEPTKFKGDYTQVPRGRVAWNIDKFIVLVGKWAEPIQEELTELLEQEFSLPYFEFVYDEHWDLGHGWSGDMPTTR